MHLQNRERVDLMLCLISMLNMIIDSTSGIRIEHVNTLFANIAATPVGNPMAFDFLINRWTDIEKSWYIVCMSQDRNVGTF